jgi:NAD(P)-dependent dehydrogenase (short-subunit alcohol dehydrogenase family)
MKILIESAWGSADPTQAAFPFHHASAFAEAGHEVQIFLLDGASCRAAVTATVQRFGGLDVLLYGAADSDRTATVLELDEAAWDRVIRVNLTGAFLMVTT